MRYSGYCWSLFQRAANKVLRGLYEVQLRQQKELMKEFEEFQATMGMPHPGDVTQRGCSAVHVTSPLAENVLGISIPV